MAVTVLLPSVLRDVAAGGRFRVPAATVREALEEVYRRVPALRFHLCEPDGRFRVHVLCLHNGADVRGAGLDRTVRDGDEIAVVQAVSGG